MKINSILKKMRSEHSNPVRYFLSHDQGELEMNPLIGQEISIHYTGKINCLACGRETSQTYFQGFCYPCYRTLPEADDCILRPELCKAHEGISRNMKWSEEHCLQTHFVYLALTDQVKVGVSGNIPTRWIDQGAAQAIILAEVPNRYTAGLIEVELKKHLSDKTNWRSMLTNKLIQKDLLKEKVRIQELLSTDFKTFVSENNELFSFEYPVVKYPAKVKMLNLDKTKQIKGKLTGIRGQYLIFEDESVLNIRRFSGYNIEMEIF